MKVNIVRAGIVLTTLADVIEWEFASVTLELEAPGHRVIERL